MALAFLCNTGLMFGEGRVAMHRALHIHAAVQLLCSCLYVGACHLHLVMFRISRMWH